jgi:SAM-dependent methyltransferase
LNGLADRIAGVEGRLDATHARVDGLEAGDTGAVADLVETVSSIGQKMTDLERRSASAADGFVELQSQVAGFADTLQDLAGQVTQTGGACQDVDRRLRKAEGRLQKAEARLDKTDRRLDRRNEAPAKARTRAEQPVEDDDWIPGYASKPGFRESRTRFVKRTVDLTRLTPAARVLDLGCGVGGVAEQLTEYLDPTGSYVGIDVDPRAIATCKRKIESTHPNFHFAVADVYNGKYNPTGRHRPAEYRFPFEEGEFDLAVLRSVFTHMLPDSIDNYLSELHRVLKPGGHALITYFLLNEETERLIDVGVSSRRYEHDHGFYKTDVADLAEAAIAFDEGWVREQHDRHGLPAVEIFYGRWRGTGDDPEWQDLVLAQRSTSGP